MNMSLIFLIVFVLLNCFIGVVKSMTKQQHNISTTFLSDSIFVGIISYKDYYWVENVVNILSNAKYPSRVFIGVIEYIESLEKSCSKNIPQKFRNNIKSIQVTIPKIVTTKKSRKKLLDKLFQNEKFVLFLKSAELCIDWDEILCRQIKITGTESMIVSHLCHTNSFACISDVSQPNKISYTLKHFRYLNSNPHIPSLIWCPEFAFSYSSVSKISLQDDTILGVSSLLLHSGIQIYYTESTIGSRADHPKGVRNDEFCNVDEQIVQNYIHTLKDRKGFDLSKHTLFGLSKYPTREEYICKYGSVKEARFALKNLKQL